MHNPRYAPKEEAAPAVEKQSPVKALENIIAFMKPSIEDYLNDHLIREKTLHLLTMLRPFSWTPVRRYFFLIALGFGIFYGQNVFINSLLSIYVFLCGVTGYFEILSNKEDQKQMDYVSTGIVNRYFALTGLPLNKEKAEELIRNEQTSL